MRLTLEHWPQAWPMREAFEISRGVQFEQATLQVRLTAETGQVGRGEACGVPYAGETPALMAAALEAVREEIEAGVSRAALLDLLPPGGARMAIDAALWDLDAKLGLPDPFAANGLKSDPVTSAFTIGMRTLAGYETAAHDRAAYPLLKIKVNGDNPLEAVRAVRRGAPTPALILDSNQSWSVADLKALAEPLAALGVVLLEQPIPVGAEAELDGWRSPVPLCADELINDLADLDKAQGRFQVINIKLDKTGGLTRALALADAAEARGFGLMVGCMAGSSLSMAPAMVLAQRCAFVDLDGPLLQARDADFGFVYSNGRVAQPHRPELWG